MSEKTKSTLSTEDGEVFKITIKGSLGLLALGYVGTMLWREKIAKTKKDKK